MSKSWIIQIGPSAFPAVLNGISCSVQLGHLLFPDFLFYCAVLCIRYCVFVWILCASFFENLDSHCLPLNHDWFHEKTKYVSYSVQWCFPALFSGASVAHVVRASALHLWDQEFDFVVAHSCEKSQTTLCRKSWGFFPPTGKVDRVGYDKHN